MLGGISAGQEKIGDGYDEWLAALEDTGPEEAQDSPRNQRSLQRKRRLPTSSSPPAEPAVPEPTTSAGLSRNWADA